MNKAQYVIGITEEMTAKKAALATGGAMLGVAGVKKGVSYLGKKAKNAIEQGHAGAGAQKIKRVYQAAKEITGN